MIAARPFQGLTRGLGRNAFDLPVAALAGLAIAVVAFAMPAELLGQLVRATGLPHLLAAAEPPLGLKARGMIGIAGAGAAFGFVFLLMRMLDGAGRGKAEPEPEAEEDRPRLRRRDLHPDAPVCRPISATRDFGEPAPPPLQRTAAQAWSAEPEETEEPLELSHHHAPSWLAEPEPDSILPEPEPFVPEPEPVPQPEAAAAPKPHPEPLADASLAELMRRLEQGLARRRTRQVFAPAPHQHAPAPQVFPEADDDRLQNAIESLQRFAARGD
jgi:hypothetical protein